VAKETVTLLTDDLDGTRDESVTTIQLGWNGEWRELELSAKNVAALGKGIDKFWNVGRPADGGGTRPAASRRARTNGAKSRRRPNVLDYDRAAYRAWCDSKGIKIGRGRQPNHRIEQFLAETTGN
jgi:hypothetical protein